jgi:F0F1-type ATP synthase membrane subunit a
MYLETAVAFLQAYIFTILLAIYLNECTTSKSIKFY